MWYIDIMEYYSAIKRKEQYLQKHGWDLEIVMLKKFVSETPTSYAITYRWNLKKRTQ